MAKLTLIPHPDNKEMIQLFDNSGYPSALVHLDTFYQPNNIGEIYERLRDGKTIVVTLSLVSPEAAEAAGKEGGS